jgi:hypothetical protein
MFFQEKQFQMSDCENSGLSCPSTVQNVSNAALCIDSRPLAGAAQQIELKALADPNPGAGPVFDPSPRSASSPAAIKASAAAFPTGQGSGTEILNPSQRGTSRMRGFSCDKALIGEV